VLPRLKGIVLGSQALQVEDRNGVAIVSAVWSLQQNISGEHTYKDVPVTPQVLINYN
jgi:hypothetical protein